jgi:hypothetical protein
VTRVYADYFVAFRITFLTRERVIAAPTHGVHRYLPYDRLVARAARPAFVFVRGSAGVRARTQELQRAGYVRYAVGRYILVAPRTTTRDRAATKRQTATTARAPPTAARRRRRPAEARFERRGLLPS